MTSTGNINMTIIALLRVDRDELENDIKTIVQQTLCNQYDNVEYYMSASTGDMLHYINLSIGQFDIDDDVASPGNAHLIDFYEMISKIENRAQLLSVNGVIHGDIDLILTMNDKRITTVTVQDHEGVIKSASQKNVSELFELLNALHQDNQIAV